LTVVIVRWTTSPSANRRIVTAANTLRVRFVVDDSRLHRRSFAAEENEGDDVVEEAERGRYDVMSGARGGSLRGAREEGDVVDTQTERPE
jgi:hypothetical protein